jgi:predicted porin
MKKKHVALAAIALCAAGSAAAQTSSVTIYGIIDVAVSKVNNGTSNLTFLPQFAMGLRDTVQVKQSTESRLGFRGTEDLGGGLRANFQIEHRFRPDDGSVQGRDNTAQVAQGFWNAQSWVGLSGNFGEVRLGRQYVPAFYVSLASDPWGYDYNVAGAAGFTRGGNGITTAYNAATYRSPALSGFTAEVQVAAGEGGSPVTQTGSQAGRNLGVSLQYTGGPLYLGAAYNTLDQAAGSVENKYWILSAAYNLGFVRPMVSYSVGTNNTNLGREAKTFIVGATAPLGGGRLKAVVARYDAAVGINPNAGSPYAAFANTTGANTNKLGLGYEYFLSKRTSVHADIGTAKTSGFTRSTGVEAGVKHVF